MKELYIKFQDCYGINLLEHCFDFSEKNASLIYAPNGTMKTSFTKTFHQVSLGKKPLDQLTGKNGSYDIKVNGNNILSKNILVINSYEDKITENMSKLLVKDDLKKEYEELMEEINITYFEFIKKLISKFGGSKLSLEKEFFNFWKVQLNVSKILDIFDSYKKINFPYEFDFKYSELFNQKTLTILKNSNFKELIKEYIDIYDSLLQNSKLFEKDKINHNNFDEIINTLKNQNFFLIKNKVVLANNITVSSLEEFKEVLENEKKAILKNDELQTKFQKIEALLTNQESKKLREILDQNRDFILELENIENFQKKIWLSYFFHLTKELNLLKEIYMKNQQAISEIIKKASQEKTEWEKVIELYNQRFKMPFKIKIANKSNSLLGIQEPQIEFEYNGYIISEDKLKKDILSTGEKRALYLLEVLYKIEILKLEGHKKIIILDDIADSFDYKNKYAIIEYLNDLIKEQDRFKLIILTHNFDFYRTIATRLDLKKNSFMTLKNEEKIILEQGQYFENIFKVWKKNVLSNQKITLVVIPFMRNLIEYSRGNKDKDYIFLTNLLHYNKNETEKITISELREVYNNGWFQNKNTITTNETTVIDALLLESDTIVQDKNENINLDNKIVLSMSIRYLSEKYMLEEILKYKTDYKPAGYNQTKDLLNNYKEINKNYLEIFEAVNLMTAENIHINSFMYEPLIDMSSNHLKELYIKIKNIK